MPEPDAAPWSMNEFYRLARELANSGSYPALLDLVWDALPRLGYPAVLTVDLFDAYRRAGRNADIEAAAWRLIPLSPEPARIAWAAASRIDSRAPGALMLARIAAVMIPGQAAVAACLAVCFDSRDEFALARRTARHHDILTGRTGQLASYHAGRSWEQQRWASAAVWYDRLAEIMPDHMRVRAFQQIVAERLARERAFPGALPIAELVGRVLPEGDRTSVLFVGARGEDVAARFRGIPPARLEVIGVDPELGQASDPAATGIALRYLRDVLSDRDEERDFFETRNGGGSSLFAASADAGRYTSALGVDWAQQLEAVARTRVRTTSVDAVAGRGDLGRVDSLYLNVQGGELAVLRGGRRTFESAVAVQVEVSFVGHYAGAPGWHQVNAELIEQGFVLVDIRSLQGVRRSRVGLDAKPVNRLGLNRWPSWQLAEAHLLYLRDPVDPARRGDRLFRSTRDWLVLALWAEYYGQIDIALEALMVLAEQPGLVEDPALAAGLAAQLPPVLEQYREFFRRHYH